MKVKQIVNETLINVTGNMYETRRKSLDAAITSVMYGADMTVTSIGRNIKSDTTEKHQIKRSDRLLSNPHLYAETSGIYKSLSHKILGMIERPIILIDWSDIGVCSGFHLLQAAVSVQGRSLILLNSLHGVEEKDKTSTQKKFLQKLNQIIPCSCKPIIVADAGFRGQWFHDITALGWDYVVRIRNNVNCKKNDEEQWQPIKELHKKATKRPKFLGEYTVSKSTPRESQLVIFKGMKKGRIDKAKIGAHRRKATRSRNHARRESEALLVCTSLKVDTNNGLFAKYIINIYRTRMQIEEGFRDSKSGLGLNLSGVRQIKRLAIMMLIIALVQYILYLIGVCVMLKGDAKNFQANTTRHRRVLSYQYLGLRAIQHSRFKLRRVDLEKATDWIRKQMREPWKL